MGLSMIKVVNSLNFTVKISLLFIWGTRIITFLAYPNPTSAPDSSTYYSHQFLDFSLVSLTGHAGRGWVIPLVYSFMPNPESIEVMQLALSGAAWSLLILCVSKSQLLNQKFSTAVVLLLTILATSAQIVQHDSIILSTSITNSLFVACVALIIYAINQKTISLKLQFAVLFICFFLSIQKTTFFPIAICLTVIVFALNRRRMSGVIKGLLYVTSGLLLAIVFVTGSNVNNSWPVSYSGQTLLWQLGGQSPVAADFRNFLEGKGAPSCITQGAPYENLDISIGKVLNECPDGAKYIKSNLQKEFIEFSVTHPFSPIKLGIFGMGAALTNSASNYGNAVNILPQNFSNLFFGNSSPEIVNAGIDSQVAGMNFLKSGRAMWIYAPLFMWVILAFAGNISRKMRSRETSILLLILVACLLQSVFIVVLLPSEWVRQTSPFIIGALIVSIVLSIKSLERISSTIATRDI